MLVPPMTKYTIHHGSDKIIEKPIFEFGKSDNDYGRGFYATQYAEKARSWAVIFGSASAVMNTYEIDTKDMNILNLDNYGPLAWIAEIVYNRYTASEECEKIANDFVKKYKVNTDNADIIIGYRAGGNYIDAIDSFLRNELNVDEVVRLFKMENLETQFVLKSKKAFDAVKFVRYENVKDNDYLKNYENALINTSKYINSRKVQIQENNYTPQGILAKTTCEIKFDYDLEYDYLKLDMTWKEYEEFEELLNQEKLQNKKPTKSEYLKEEVENLNDTFADITDSME